MRERTRGLRVRGFLPLEPGFLLIHQLDYPDLQRLALFVLSHTLVDQLLSALLTNDQLFDRGGTRSLPELRSIATTIRRRKFGPRLKSAACSAIDPRVPGNQRSQRCPELAPP
jgi:hypothetical protein